MIVPPNRVTDEPLEVAKSPLATAPVVTTEFEVPLTMIVPLVLEEPARIPALAPYLSLLSVLEASPLVLISTVSTVSTPPLYTRMPD